MPKTSAASKVTSLDWTDRPKYHSYPTKLIMLSIQLLYHHSIGLTRCRYVIQSVLGLFSGPSKLPARSTLGSWRDKFGYLADCAITPAVGSSWALLIDESITVKSSKMLLLIGVDLNQYDFGGPLRFEDIVVLDAAFQPGWTGQQIQERIKRLVDRGFDIKYAVSDRGPNLVKGLCLSGLIHLEDCSHRIALCLKRTYSKRTDFQEFEAQCTLMKRQGAISTYSHLLPPTLKTHSRFMNLDKGVNWAVKTLKLFDQHQQHRHVTDHIDKIQWLGDHRQIIDELQRALSLGQRLQNAMKEEGFSHQLADWALRQIKATSGISPRLRHSLLKYIEELRRKTEQGIRYLCSTDIVESLFSVLKRNKNLADHRLCQLVHGHCSPITLPIVKYRMQNVNLKTLNQKNRTHRQQPGASQIRREVYALVS